MQDKHDYFSDSCDICKREFKIDLIDKSDERFYEFNIVECVRNHFSCINHIQDEYILQKIQEAIEAERDYVLTEGECPICNEENNTIRFLII